MYDCILIPLDGSAVAEAILSRGLPILRSAGSELVLLRVVDLSMDQPGHGEAFEEASTYIRTQAELLRDQGLDARSIVEVGDPVERIVHACEQHHASLIAISTHGRTGPGRWLLGSVTERLLRTSVVPLLIDRSSASRAGPYALHRVVVALDGSEQGMCAVPHAARVARAFGADIELLHVGVQPPKGITREIYGESLFGRAEALLEIEGMTGQPTVREGDPAAVILAAPDADLIVLSTHGYSGLDRFLMGSVAERVIRHADVPLLVVPRSASTVSSTGGAVR